MPKDIAVVGYNLDPNSSNTKDAIVIRDHLNANGYSAELVHQWSLNEQDARYFKKEADWERYDGIVLDGIYYYWTLLELVRSGRPVVCATAGFADDLGLGENPQEHFSEDDFTVMNNTHPITTGMALGSLSIGNPVWTDSISTHNHLVDVLIRTLAGKAVLVAHKTRPLVYFGWYRMSQASSGSPLFGLLVKSANWAFAGP